MSHPIDQCLIKGGARGAAAPGPAIGGNGKFLCDVIGL